MCVWMRVWVINYFFFLSLFRIFQVFGLWLPSAKGRSGTPAVATKSWYIKEKSTQFNMLQFGEKCYKLLSCSLVITKRSVQSSVFVVHCQFNFFNGQEVVSGSFVNLAEGVNFIELFMKWPRIQIHINFDEENRIEGIRYSIKISAKGIHCIAQRAVVTVFFS